MHHIKVIIKGEVISRTLSTSSQVRVKSINSNWNVLVHKIVSVEQVRKKYIRVEYNH